MDTKKDIRKRNLKYLLRVVIFFAILIFIYKIFSFMCVDDTESMTRITFHEFYEKAGTIDTLMVGPSHIQVDIDGTTMTEETGDQWYSVATSLQDMAGSYHVLKEGIRENNIKKVYLEVSPEIMGKTSTFPSRVFIITDYMKFSMNKLEYIFKDIPDDYKLNAIFPLIRSLDHTEPFDMDARMHTAFLKLTTGYRDYDSTFLADQKYAGRGNWQRLKDTTTGHNDFSTMKTVQATASDITVSLAAFTDEEYNYLDKIVQECKDNNIELTIMMMPVTDLELGSDPQRFDDMSNWLEQYSEQNGAAYMDFNRVSRQAGGLEVDDSDFMNIDHFNDAGTEKFTQVFLDYVQNNLEGYKVYDSVADRLAVETGDYGIIYEYPLETKDDKVSVFGDFDMDTAADTTKGKYQEPEVDEDTTDMTAAEKQEQEDNLEYIRDYVETFPLRLESASSDPDKILTWTISTYDSDKKENYTQSVTGAGMVEMNIPAKYNKAVFDLVVTDQHGNTVYKTTVSDGDVMEG